MYLKGKQLCSVDFRTAWDKLGCFGMRNVRALFARLQKHRLLSDCGTALDGFCLPVWTGFKSELDGITIRIRRNSNPD